LRFFQRDLFFTERHSFNGGALAMTGCSRKTCLRSIPLAFVLAVTTPSQVAAADGVLDTSFGTAGVAITDFTGGMDSISALAVQPDGKIVTAGMAGPSSEFYTVSLPFRYNLALARYNTDGSLDASFGNGGKVTTIFPNKVNSGAHAIVLQPDGKIVAAGWTDSLPKGSFALARYNSDGSLDAAFGSGGMVVTTSFGDIAAAGASAVAIEADSKIVAAGPASFTSGSPGVAFIRYNSDGSLDPTFGSGGVVHSVPPTGFFPSAYFVQPNGWIYVGGSNSPGFIFDGKFLLARYNSDGTLDSNFGLGGVATADFLESNGNNYAEVGAIAVQPDGKILTAGLSGVDESSAFLGLARFNTDGSVDSAFGSGGRVVTAFAYGDSGASALAVQLDGKIIAAGGYQTTFNSDFALARYNIDGSLDQTFGDGGKVTADFFRYENASAVGIEPDGSVVAAGYSGDSPVSYSFAVARFTNTPIDAHIVLTPSSVRLGGSFTASASGSSVNNNTYLDVLFRSPLGDAGQVLNWQLGLAASHDVPAAITPGLWIINGLRPHQDQNDHAAGYIPALQSLMVSDVVVADVKISPTSVNAGGSFTVVVSGVYLFTNTYFDVRYRSPGGAEQVSLNWQRGTSASHIVAIGTASGTWTITGIWAHTGADDHSSDFAPVSATITVNP
jgi:uncharacterized delta-60 repeat protein